MVELSDAITDGTIEGWFIPRYLQEAHPELNSVADVGWCALGFWFASRAPWWASVALLVVAEVGCAWWIHDNLTLNILMLVHPIDAVRAWQMSIAPT